MSQAKLVERVLGISDRTGRLTVAIICGGLAAVAFGGSLVFEWGYAALRTVSSSTESHFGIESFQPLATGYVLGVPMLLGALGLAVDSPRLASPLRIAATGFGIGLAAILVAATLEIDQQFPDVSSELSSDPSVTIVKEYSKGLYFAFGALLLVVAAVWLTGPSPWHRRRSTLDIPAPSIGDVQPVSEGLRVSAAEPLDWPARPGESLQ